LLRTKLHNDMR